MANTGSDEVDRFGWVHCSTIQEAACLTFVRGTDLDLVARRFGAVTERVQKLDFDEYCEEAFAHQDRYPVIGVRALGEWALVAEDSGFQGTRPEVLRQVSAGTEAVSVCWDVNELTRFTHAVDGEVRTAFEALVPGYRVGADPDGLEEVRAGLPWSSERYADGVALMLALAARITGHPLTPEVLEGDFATYPVAAWPRDLPDSPEALLDHVGLDEIWRGPDAGAPGADPAELLESLRRADADRCRAAAASVARYVLDATAGLDHLVVGETLRALEDGRDFDRSAIGEVVRVRRWELHQRQVTSADRAQVRALEALRQATNSDPLTALLAALAQARRLRLEQRDITDRVTTALSG